ncbi:MAG: hypothetical protein LBD70_01060 [Bifidobacteriaceae bacterium]|jgi:hypothetical protein|nr:hypothetical protein [Bifidobacteriaceae bacterium]
MRKSPVIILAALAAAALTACGDAGDGDTDKPQVDDGTVVVRDPTQLEALDAELATEPQPGEGWLSAPWGNVSMPRADSQELQIYYVAGDTECYAHAGFTLDESDSQVTLGSYVHKVEGATDCPENPARAFKWGTVKLANPLGERQLVHAALDDPYRDYVWDPLPTAVQPAPGAESEPPAGDAEPSEGGETPGDQDGASDTPDTEESE